MECYQDRCCSVVRFILTLLRNLIVLVVILVRDCYDFKGLLAFITFIIPIIMTISWLNLPAYLDFFPLIQI
jgi:hypothetical protein